MRLFFAIFPPKEALDEIRDVVRKLDKIKRNFRFIPYEQLHLTVKFLGANVSADSFELLAKHFSQVDFKIPKLSVRLNKVQFGFSGQLYPHVMFISVDNDALVGGLTDQINDEIKKLEIEDVIRKKDRNRALNHITIARVKRTVSKSLTKETREVLNKIETLQFEFEVKEFYLMQSILTPIGPKYKKLTKFEVN